MGDVVDEKCKGHPDGPIGCLREVLNDYTEALPNTPRFDLIGNHELYLFTREEFKQELLATSQTEKLVDRPDGNQT